MNEPILCDVLRVSGIGLAIPPGWNGSVGGISLSKPRDYTGDWGKIVAVANNFNLAETLRYYLWIAQEKPDAATVLTQPHLDVAIPHFINAIARYRVYRVFHEAGVDLLYRQSDIVLPAIVPGGVGKPDLVQRLHNELIKDGPREIAIAEEARLLMMSLVANAIHREQNGDHSWFPAEVDNFRSPTAKTLSVAGRDADSLKAYMVKFGHDGNHHLNIVTISKMASILSGSDDATFTANFQYEGINVNGSEMRKVVNIGEAAQGRFPAGVLGKAALVIGVSMMKAMIMNLSTRVKITNAANLSVNIDALGSVLQGTSIKHSAVIHLGRALGPAISMVFGFVTEAKLIDEDTFQAFKNHANRFAAEVTSGKSIAKTLRVTKPHKSAITGAIIASFATMNNAIVAAAAVNIADDAAAAAVPALATVVAVDVTQISAEVGTNGSDDVFYDTQSTA